MIKWYDNLYVDSYMKKKSKKIKKQMDAGKFNLNVYCIAFASDGTNLFDIMNTNELLFQHYKKQDIRILGLAFGRESAILLVKEMVEEIYRNTGGFQVREYFVFRD